MNKKYYLLIIVLILIVTGGSFFWIYQKNKNDQIRKQKAQMEEVNKLLSPIKCSFQNDGEANAQAVNSKDIAYCSCVKDEKRKENCQRGVMDANYYERAVAQYDDSICQNISEESIKNSCLNVVLSGVDNLQQNDPKKLADTYLKNGNFAKAEGVLVKLVNANPQDVSNILNLALGYANQALFEHKEAELIPKALALVESAEKFSQNNPEVFRVKGFIFEIKPDLVASIDSYTKAIEINSEYVPAYVGRGHAKNIFGDLNGALDDFNKAKNLDKEKTEIDIYANLCRLESTKDDLMLKAVDDCQTALALSDDNAIRKSEVFGILSEIYIKLSRIEEAKINVEKALAFSPNDANILYLVARVANIQKEYIKAEAAARKALGIDSFKTVAYNALSFSLFQQKKYDDSIVFAQRGIDVIEKDASLLAPSKNSVKKELYLNLYNAFGMKGEEKQAEEYKKMANNL